MSFKIFVFNAASIEIFLVNVSITTTHWIIFAYLSSERSLEEDSVTIGSKTLFIGTRFIFSSEGLDFVVFQVVEHTEVHKKMVLENI